MKVLVSPTAFGQCGNEPLDLLDEAEIEAVMNPYHRRLSAQEVVELASGCQGIIAGVEPLDAYVLERLPHLRCISRVGVGLQNVDLQAAAACGVAVRNTPDGPTAAVAELTIGLAFALLRSIPLADRNIRNRIWKKEMGYLLQGKQVGIIGLGRIGRLVAEKFINLGCDVCATDPVPDANWVKDHPVSLLPLEDLLCRSDIVSLHLANEPGDRPVIGETEIEWMKGSAFLLNLARGGVVDEKALYQALSTERIAGAALDVFVDEPYYGRLAELDQVILTPHLGSYAREGRLRMEVQAVRNLLEVLMKDCAVDARTRNHDA